MECVYKKMGKKDLLIKSTYTLFLITLLVGLSLLIIFNNPIGLLIEIIGLFILLLVIVWAS